MKMRIVITSVFAIMLFAVMANAQHTRVIIGDDQGVWVNAAQSSVLSAMPSLDVIAGRPIRVRAEARKDEKQDDIIAGAGLGARPHVKSTPISCESVSPSVRKAGGTQQEYLTITMKDVMLSSTDPAWKNSCRLLTVKLQNGREYRAKIRFR